MNLILFLLLAFLPLSAHAQGSAQAPNLIYATPCSGSGFLALRSACAADVAPITPGGDLAGTLAVPTIAKIQGVVITGVAGTGKAVLDGASDRLRSLQSFGAVGDGVTDDTTAVQTALNSGDPLVCNGSFIINTLVTVTNHSVYMTGGHQGCKLILNSSQSMLYFTLTGNAMFSRNTVFLRDIYVSVTTTITSVTGPAQTAAFYITYPAGSAGTASPLVDIDHVQIQGSASGNYIKQGVYVNDAVDTQIRHFTFEGNRAAYTSTINGIVFDGTHSPALLTVQDSTVDFAGNGILAQQETTGGWQGLRVANFDCIYCGTAIKALGSLDGTSDQLVVTGSEGPVQNMGVLAQNVIHQSITGNYFFLADMAISGGSHAAFPVCYENIWNMAIPSNGGTADITGNSCDGAQVTGYTARYGISFVNVTSTLGMASHVGTNMHTALDFSVGLQADTAGVVIEHQTMKGVTAELQDLSAAGANTYVPPLARTDAAAQTAGLAGEVLSVFVASGSAISEPVSGTAINIGTIALTAGNWMCNGTVWTMPATGTTTSALFGALSTTSITLPSAGSLGVADSAAAVPATVGESVNFGPVPVLLSSPTTLYLVGNSNFATSTMKLYGSAQCVRYM